VISTIEEQVERELVQPNRTRDFDESIIRVNFHCNQACSFCFVSTHLPTVDDARLHAAIHAAAARGERIVLSGGEPTLHPRLLDLIRLAKQASPLTVQLQTNAVLLDDPALAFAIAEAGVAEAFVSLHGATAEVSDAITGAPGTFARTVVGLDNLARTPIYTILNFVIHRDNHRELPAYVRLAASRWPEAAINLSFVAPSADVVPRTPALVPRYSEVRGSLLEGLAEATRLGRRVVGFESMCGLPLCLVPPSFREGALPEIEPGYDRGEFDKPEPCTRCALERRCHGVRRGYVELYGTSELVPVAAS
jgi:pyruvate-formate lyase-activating enzyme